MKERMRCIAAQSGTVGLRFGSKSKNTKYVGLGFHQVWYQGGVKATVSGVVEDLNFKISEGSDPNWCFPDSAQLAVSV